MRTLASEIIWTDWSVRPWLQYKSAKGKGKGDLDFGAVHSNYQH